MWNLDLYDSTEQYWTKSTSTIAGLKVDIDFLSKYIKKMYYYILYLYFVLYFIRSKDFFKRLKSTLSFGQSIFKSIWLFNLYYKSILFFHLPIFGYESIFYKFLCITNKFLLNWSFHFIFLKVRVTTKFCFTENL